MTPKVSRCAVYTRKSTDHNLGLAFNSLDAQREACQAYITSQAHEGWTLVPTHFDDGGLSGASLDRPALKALLEVVRAKKIDIIVVYKVDRLTRSLADFAKLVELFDKNEVSFVSVTQSFNTTSSMGRLTLNVLLSFAQFEREVIGERVRDKISASKRKGIWVGGPLPLGYRSVDKKLEIIPEEAALVRTIFADYLRLGSIVALADALETQGIRPKRRVLSTGRVIATTRFGVGPLAHLLKNRFYVGDVVYQGEVHPGPQQPILDKILFEAVQAKLKDSAVRRATKRATSPSLLVGRFFDDRGNPMTPTHANKKGVRYRYYTSHALIQGRKVAAGSVARVSAPEVERSVIAAVRSTRTLSNWSDLTDSQLVQTHVARITVFEGRLEVALKGDESTDQKNGLGAALQIIEVPYSTPSSPRKGILDSGGLPSGNGLRSARSKTIDDDTSATLLAAIARSKAWLDALCSGAAASFADIARTENLAERHVRFLAPLAYLSPRIVEAIADGHAPAGLTVSKLARRLPTGWRDQETRIRE